MNRKKLREQFDNETGKGCEIPDWLGQPITFSEYYVKWLEDKVVKNCNIPHVSGSVFCSCLTRTAIPKGDKFICKYCGLEIKN